MNLINSVLCLNTVFGLKWTKHAAKIVFLLCPVSFSCFDLISYMRDPDVLFLHR